MRWCKPIIGPGCGEAYAQVSADGRYSVTRIGVGEGAYRYETWRTRAHAEGPHLVAVNLTTSDEARKRAEEDDADDAV